MLRTSLGLLALVSVAACGYDEDGNWEFCFHPGCDGEGGGGGGGGEPADPQPPISFGFDRGANQSTTTLARGGVLRLDVRSNPPQIPNATENDAAISLDIVSSARHLTEVDVHGDEVGEGTIIAKIPTEAETSSFRVLVAELATVQLAVPARGGSDSVRVLTDIRSLGVFLKSTDGTLLLDHSLGIDVSSDPGFSLARWDSLSIPSTAGDYVVSVTRANGDVYPLGVAIFDHVDDIVSDFTPNNTVSGHVCLRALVGGEPVETRAWKYTDQHNATVFLSSQTPECVDFIDATPGATMTVELAGTTKVIALR